MNLLLGFAFVALTSAADLGTAGCALTANELQGGKYNFERGLKIVTDEQKLYKWLFDPSREYDPNVPPPSFDEKGNIRLHTEIDIQLELMGVMQVDKDASTVTFKAAFR